MALKTKITLFLIKKISFIIVFVLFIVLLYCPSRVIIDLNGDNKVLLGWNSQYKELGGNAKVCCFLKCQDLSNNLVIKNNIDNSKIGTYIVKYSLKYDNKEYNVERKVILFEKTSPVIELYGNKEIGVCPGRNYIDEGYIAYDNYDGDITNKVVVNDLPDGIHYIAVDSSNNKTEVIRKRTYSDNEVPSINLIGNNTVYVEKNTLYEEPGYKAYDNCDGDITNRVVVSGSINTEKEGDYIITYTVSDSLNNTVSVERKIKVYSFDTKDKDEYAEALTNYLKQKDYHVSVIYYNLDNDYTYKYNENEMYYGASLIKTVAAMYVYEKLNVTDKLRTNIKPMIEKSSNKAYFAVGKSVGYDKIKKYGKSLGAKNTLNGDDKFGYTTAEDQLIYWQHLYSLINKIPLKNELKSYFLNNNSNYLLFDGSPSILHKYGYTESFFHDVGIVFDKKPYIIIILTQEGYHNYKDIITNISHKIYDFNQLV